MKQIPLTQGKFALVDDEDYERINQWKWHIGGKGYAIRTENFYKPCGRRTSRTIMMHRYILCVETVFHVDHINHDRLDNRRFNLRKCTRSQNLMNTQVRKNKSLSRYKGVARYARDKRWLAYINKDGIRHRLGRFEKEEDAAMAYNKKAIELFGAFALLNAIENA